MFVKDSGNVLSTFSTLCILKLCRMLGDALSVNSLRTIVIETKGALTTQAMSPETSEINIGLGHLGVGKEEPETEDGLGENVQDSISDDLSVDRHFSGAISNTPNTTLRLAKNNEAVVHYLHGVGSPDDQSEPGNSEEELGDIVALSCGLSPSVDSKVPDDNKVGNAGNGVPAPLLRSALRAVGSKETSKDHDDIGNDSHQDVSSIETGQQA
jgi:hypothetical protein